MSKVVDSDHPNFKSGDFVSGVTGWEEYSLIQKTEQLRKIRSEDLPLSYHVGLLGRVFFLIKQLMIVKYVYSLESLFLTFVHILSLVTTYSHRH